MKQEKATQYYRINKILRFLKSQTFKYQHSLILMLFISAVLIFLDLGLFSASFIFGLSLIVLTYLKTPKALKPKGVMWYLFAFLVIALLSLLFSEEELGFKDAKIYIQTIYWYLLSVIVYRLYPLINKEKLSKYILFSTALLLVLYIVGFRYRMTQNAVAFSVIICAPLGYYYLKKLWYRISFATVLTFLMLLNGSRTGAIIIILQFLLMLLLTIPMLNRYFKTTLIVLVLLIITFNIEPVRVGLGRMLAPYNEELGLLLLDPDLVMMNDMSWLTRVAQIQKGKQIFAEHPILGIGYTKFPEYDIVIDESQIVSDRPLKGIDNRSAHNSYVALVSETGILGLAAFILFFLQIGLAFWKNINRIGGKFESYVFISFIGMLIYFYTITAFLGTSAWIMYGLIAGAAYKINIRKVIKLNKACL